MAAILGSAKRYDFEPLERLLLVRLRDRSDHPERVGVKNIADALGEDAQTIRRARTNGLLREAAERLAEAAGFMPYEVWPEILDEDIAAVEAVERVCSAEGCTRRFLPIRWNHVYCLPRCRRRAKAARHRAKHRRPIDPAVRFCEAVDCSNTFTPSPFGRGGRGKRFCSPTCQSRMKNRRLRSKPERRELDRARQRRYDAEVRAAALARGQRDLERRRPAA